MIPRPSTRPRPIPFAMATQAPQDAARSAPTPFASRPAEDPRRSSPGPVHWGDTPGGALVMPAEDPRGLYNVTRNWQGQTVALDAPAPTCTLQTATATARPEHPSLPGRIGGQMARASQRPPQATGTGELSVRYLGQGALCVRSSVTGRQYRFTGHGHTLRIDKHDLMLMRRISDVELL